MHTYQNILVFCFAKVVEKTLGYPKYLYIIYSIFLHFDIMQDLFHGLDIVFQLNNNSNTTKRVEWDGNTESFNLFALRSLDGQQIITISSSFNF